MGGGDGNVAGHLEAQLGLAVDDEGVGQIGGILGLVVIVAVVAQQLADALALGLEVGHDEGVATAYLGIGQARAYHAVGLGGEAEIAYGVEQAEAPGVDGVVYLGGLGILLRHGLIADAAAEVAVVVEHVLGHGGAQLGIDPRHEHGLLAEGLAGNVTSLAMLATGKSPSEKGTRW